MSSKFFLVRTLSTASLTSKFKVQSSRFEVRPPNLQLSTCNLQPIRGLLKICRAASLLFLLASTPALPAANAPSGLAQPLIRIATAHSTLSLCVGDDGRVYQLAYGSSDAPLVRTNRRSRCMEFHPQYGDGFIFEPALQATHSDGNTSTDLIYVKHSTISLDSNVSLTRIELKDPAYPFFVTLNLKSYRDQDIIEQWTEIRHEEATPVTLYRFASSAPILPRAESYWVTHFHGDWAKEAQWVEERLSSGIKILDSKIGVRADQYRTPLFLLALNHEAREEEGEVFGGTLEWSGSFQFAFEMDANDRVRVLSGMNPFASQYRLPRGQAFITPAMLWSWSGEGKGQVSRNFHRWARRYGIRDGDKPRPVLVNNWEATGFNFNESTIVALFDGAKALGAETFLLDDGWFGNGHPRNDDHAGLGDWEVNTNKLPRGLSHLAQEAKQRGINFGIWLEPEMMNPKSDLFEHHPEWAIRQPHRELELSRNQLNLDLSRPEVREFAWKVIDHTLGQNPGIGCLKWDANRYVTQPGSTWLPADQQSHLLIDYNFALYDVMARMAKNYPNVTAMLCSGGGGRVDYGALKYFHCFWPSDDTNPRDRVFIQWGYSHIFPASTIAAHVTKMGNCPLKFALDVAMSGALGADLDIQKLAVAERQTLVAGFALYKSSVRDVVSQGDLYRLESPYASPRAALDYVSDDRSRSILFVYQLKPDRDRLVKPRGLDAQRQYRVREINLPEGRASHLAQHGRLIDGASLMRDGLVPPCHKEFDSAVIEFTDESTKQTAANTTH